MSVKIDKSPVLWEAHELIKLMAIRIKCDDNSGMYDSLTTQISL